MTQEQQTETAFRPAWAGEMPDWMEPFRRRVDAAKKYVVSSTLDRVDWRAEFVRGGGKRNIEHRTPNIRWAVQEGDLRIARDHEVPM